MKWPHKLRAKKPDAPENAEPVQWVPQYEAERRILKLRAKILELRRKNGLTPPPKPDIMAGI